MPQPHYPKRTYKIPSDAGLKHILESLGSQERLALTTKYYDGGISALREELRFVVRRLNERRVANEIDKAAWRLGFGKETPAWVREHGLNFQNRPIVYSDEMLAGNVLPESIFPALTGKRPSVYNDGEAVKFVLAVFKEFGIKKYTADGVVMAMRRFKVAERNRRLTAERKNTPSESKKASRTGRG